MGGYTVQNRNRSTGEKYVSMNDCVTLLFEPFNTFDKWSPAGGPTIVPGRNGTGASVATGQVLPYTSLGAYEYVTVGFAYQTNNLANTPYVFQFRSGGTIVGTISVTPAGALQWRTGTNLGGSQLAVSGAGAIAINTWYYIELQARINDIGGYVQARINGVDVFSVSGIDTNPNQPDQLINLFQFASVAATTILADDMYLSVGPDCKYKGSIVL